jgi:hypothetical protein
MTEELEAIKRKRFEYLHLLYKTAQGRYDVLVHTWELGGEIGLTRDETERVVDYLRNERLIRTLTFDKVAITHQGVLQIEQALSQPDKPTDYFPPVNIINVQQMVNSQIQQGTYQSTQTADFSQDDLEEVTNFVNSLKGQLSEFGLVPEKEVEAQAEIASVEAQLKSPRPKSSIIKECLLSLRSILEGMAGNAAAALLLQQLARLLGTGP